MVTGDRGMRCGSALRLKRGGHRSAGPDFGKTRSLIWRSRRKRCGRSRHCARRIGLHVVRFGVDHQRRSTVRKIPECMSVPRSTTLLTTVAFAVAPLAATGEVLAAASPACAPSGFSSPCFFMSGLKCPPAVVNPGASHFGILMDMDGGMIARRQVFEIQLRSRRLCLFSLSELQFQHSAPLASFNSTVMADLAADNQAALARPDHRDDATKCFSHRIDSSTLHRRMIAMNLHGGICAADFVLRSLPWMVSAPRERGAGKNEPRRSPWRLSV